MRTKYSEKNTLIAIPQVIRFLIDELIFISRGKALLGELADLRGLIGEDTYTSDDIELLRILENPVVKLGLEAIDTLWTICQDFSELNGFDPNEAPYNPLATELADDLVNWFLASSSCERRDKNGFIKYEGFHMFFLTAPHVLYETAMLLMTGETGMGDPEYCSPAWDKQDEIIEELNRSDLNVNLLAAAIEMLFIWEKSYCEMDEE